MQLIIDKQQKPSSFTGLSLVLFLFLSMLSMMAAYEASKPPEDIRGAAIVSLHEYSSISAESEADNHILFVGGQPSYGPAFEQVEYSQQSLELRVALVLRAFNARAPPAQTTPAS